MHEEIERFIQWVRMRSPHAKTWRDYRCDLELFQGVIGDRNAEDVHPRDIDNFIHFQTQRSYKPSTVNRRLAAVVSFYRHLNIDGRVIACPVLAKRHYLREPQRLPRPVDEEQLRRFFCAVQDVRDRAMFTLMLRCGLRIGEVSDLQISDLYLGESSSRMIVRGKGDRERTMYLSPETERILQNWLVQRPKTQDKHVFVSYQHKQLSTTSINSRINRARMISGVELTAHRLRHTFADHLLSAGMPITSIQKLMGHRFVETTQNYAVANDRQVESDFYKACEKLEGWQLLLESVSPTDLGLSVAQEMHEKYAQHADEEETASVNIPIPPIISRLPSELTQQLESYRQLKANRWRSERVTANSILFFSKFGILWSFFCEKCGVKSASDLILEHVLQFVKFRLDAGCSARTVNGSLSSLRSFLSFLKEDDVYVHPSLENIQRIKESERLPRYIAVEKVLRLKSEVDKNGSRNDNDEKRYLALLCRAAFYLLWQGGLRSGEVELLRFSDFYVSTSDQAKRLFVRDGKWRKGRAVYLTNVALDALRSYLALRGMEWVDGYVFIRNGRPLRKNFLAQSLKTIGRQVDVSVTPHRLRHTFATQLLNAGCRVTSIQKLLGHTNLNTTMTYARAFDQTVMLDYFCAINVIESQPGGAWFGMESIQTDAKLQGSSVPTST